MKIIKVIDKKKIEVCLSPALYKNYENKEAIAVVTDVLRASSAIVAAFMNGAKKIIPVATLEEAKAMKDSGYMVAAERDGIVRDFADFGNSPFNFTPERVKDNDIVYSTTNGTQAIQLASSSKQVLVGAFLNLGGIIDHLKKENTEVLILCAGWKNKINLEDTLFAGAVVDALLKTDQFYTICDSAYAAQDLWLLAKDNLVEYIQKAAQRTRLKKNNLDDVIEYCHTLNQTSIIPILRKNHLVKL
ncbi:MAG: 2-phosphosulfolactate phosphatase [Bacteroidales bacterium]|nr:2-phosphosulfolactate phosphatase [Bacteroidales bacterium]